MFAYVRRWFIIPALLVLAGAMLVLFDIIEIYSELPVDTIATVAAVIAGAVLVLVLLLEARAIAKSWELPEPEDPPSHADIVIETKPLNKADNAEESVERAEDFSKRATERVMIDIDIEDARDDD